LTRTGIEPNYENIDSFAESYHQSRINSISDEMIEEYFTGEIEIHYKNETIKQMTTATERIEGAKWFKQKLLSK